MSSKPLTTAPAGKVLIILSDARSFPLKKTSGPSAGNSVAQPTGYFLTELAKPLQTLLSAGYEVTFASPLGYEPIPDPNSESLLAFAGNFYERQRENELIDRMKRENGFAKPRRFGEISNEELEGFDGVFVPGGHAPLTDLGDDEELGRILRHFHARGKPTAVICHGPYAFLSTRAGGKEFAYKGYQITSWSDVEEKVMDRVLGGDIPKVETALREAGAKMVEGVGEKIGRVTVDREVTVKRIMNFPSPRSMSDISDNYENGTIPRDNVLTEDTRNFRMKTQSSVAATSTYHLS
ncbi:class I glutamine amidotransferase-like protein [Eremomyces bilateralis CBS 781.70]|uniref:D-lactate dehydratase n=1 Tax=Eremomyces bilateralis CBS 781.70 TaxID=1392243 RepID=A0A6G1FSJ5_9PEZI|nr:class I glutamine amidotransferase-like protein [Eremomyces bilateralis CBS 781.70]KAF1808835.1 class I glutamine amidotransferase-like protein [Eremomyces bilateralis CBS 781.70]